MKTILICPNQASGLTVMADTRPLVTLPVLGEPFICYWLQHLASEKLQEVRVITGDPIEAIQNYTEEGSRWGLKVEVLHEVRDLKPDEARKRYRPAYETDWAPEPLDVIEATHLPGLPEVKLFNSYAEWFNGLRLWLPLMVKTKRVGMKELSPGVWVGRRTRISRTARLLAPCWIGDHVQVGKNSTIGPNAFLEDQVVVDSGCIVENGWIGPETFLGSLTELRDSLAWGNLLINWKTGSHTFITDPFLLTSLSDTKDRDDAAVASRSPEESPSPLARRFGGVISLAQKLQS